MKRILARTFLQFSTQQLFEMLEGEFIVVFDDGELVTNARETCYSSFAWDFHRQFPKTKMLRKHHVRNVLGDSRLGSKTHLKLLGNAVWSVHDAYLGESSPTLDTLSRMVYRKTNDVYNELTYQLEDYVMSLDITDFRAVLKHPMIAKINKEVMEHKKNTEDAYKVITDVLMSPSELIMNPIAKAVQSGVVNLNQALQAVGPRGSPTDVDSYIFPEPIRRGFVVGFRTLYESMAESRSAAMSLYFSKIPLQDAEYFSRRLQLLCQVVRNLHHGDCGSNKYLNWKIRGAVLDTDGKMLRQGDLTLLAGKYYLDEETRLLKAIRASDTHLINRTLKIRSVIAGCAHPDRYGVCSTCFGEMSYSVPENTNIGHMCSTHMTQQTSQSVLSTKHLVGSAKATSIELDVAMRSVLASSDSGNSYLLSERLKGKKVELIFAGVDVISLTDIDIVDDITKLSESRVSDIDFMTVRITDNDGVIDMLPVTVSIGRRKASMTYAFLEYVRKKRWVVDDRGNYIIDMGGWDYTKEFLTLPMKHFNMSDHSKDLADMIESSVTSMKGRDTPQNSESVLAELFDLVNSKLSVNLAALEITLYAACVVSMHEGDYSLPKAGTPSEMGVSALTLRNRSLGAALAYEDQKVTILSPSSFFHNGRPSHPMDVFLRPDEAVRDNYPK